MIATREPALYEARHSCFAELFDASAQLETLAEGFAFTEGPVWHSGDGYLLFTDIPASRIYRWDRSEGLAVFRDPSGMANGLAFDRQGSLLCCEHETSRVTRIDPGGSLEVVAAGYGGRELNSPNDIVVAGDGTIFFTDPIYGREAFWGLPRPIELEFRGVYAVDAGSSEPRLLAKDLEAPNGLCLSGGEDFLFVNDSESNVIRRLRLTADREVAEDLLWARLEEIGQGSADGMKLDRNGNLLCCGPGGIHVYSPQGECIGVLRLPEFAANLCFGGAGLNELFITATTRLLRLKTLTAAAGG